MAIEAEVPLEGGSDIDGVATNHDLNPWQGLVKVFLPVITGAPQGMQQIQDMEDAKLRAFYTKRGVVRNPFTRFDLRRNGFPDLPIRNTVNSHVGKVRRFAKEIIGQSDENGNYIVDQNGLVLPRVGLKRGFLIDDDTVKIATGVDEALRANPELELLFAHMALIAFYSPENDKPKQTVPTQAQIDIVEMNGWGYDEVGRTFEDLRSLDEA